MLDNCTPGASKVIVIAQEEARRCRQVSILPEHILFGLISDESGASAKILKAAGLKSEAVRSEIEKMTKPSFVPPPSALPLDPVSLQVLAAAREETRRLGSDTTGSDHLLLGMLQHGDNRGIEVLRALGMDARRLRSQVEQMIMYAPKAPPVTPQAFSINIAFADKANELVNKAKDACSRSGGRLIGSEHYLVAMVADAGFLGGEPLRQKGITADRVIAMAEMLPADRQADSDKIELINRFELTRVLQQAFSDAISMQEMVGTCHVLAAMIKQRDSRGSQILSGMGVDPGEIANDLEQLLIQKREDAANLDKTLGATVKTMVHDATESKKSLPPKLKLDAEELLARIDFEQGKLETAAARLQQLILFRAGDQSPGGDERMRRLLHHLALAYIKQERYADAESTFERALKIQPNKSGSRDLPRAGLLNNLGWMLMLQGRTDEAIAHLEQAIAIIGTATDFASMDINAQVQNNLAECLRAHGDLPGAGTLLQSSMESRSKLLAPDDPQLAFNHINIGKFLMAINRLPEASESFAKALALQELSLDTHHPDLGYTLKDYAPLLDAMKRHDLAASARERVDAIRSKHCELAQSR